ncbi:MAG TPA: FmdB family zinc ribbon protein [Actinomycetota bacterium]|nr:FmdB family zinc ribbon protein [Actinomycetota bacterium]
MPTYVYECTSCKNRSEAVQKFSDPPLETCEQCGGELRRVIFPASIQFKGSGFYSTDNRRPAGAAKAKPGDKEKGGSGSGDGAKGESSSGKSGNSSGGSSGGSGGKSGGSSATRTAEKSA